MSISAVLMGIWVTGPRQNPAFAQDEPPRVGPAKPVDAATLAWCERVSKETIGTIGVKGAVRYNLVVDDRYLYFTQSEFPNGAPPPNSTEPATPEVQPTDPEDEDDGPQAFNGNVVGRLQLAPPEPSKRTIMRVNRTGEARLETVGEVGRYSFAFFLYDIEARVACIRQNEDTNGDGAVTAADARSLWTCAVSGSEWRKVYQGSPNMTLAGVVEKSHEAFLVEPTEQPFENRILRVDLEAEKAVPKEFTHGLFVECVDPEGAFVVVARATVRTDEPAMRFPGMQRGGFDPNESSVERAIYNPPNHVMVPLADGKPETTLLAGEEWMRIAFIDKQIAYFEMLMVPPTMQENSGHPTWQAHHTLGYLDIKNQTRIPISSNAQFDDQLVGTVTHGTLYLHITNINRQLTIYTGENRHALVRELTPLSCEFLLSPDGGWLYFLEYDAGTVAPFDPYRTPTVLRMLRLETE